MAKKLPLQQWSLYVNTRHSSIQAGKDVVPVSVFIGTGPFWSYLLVPNHKIRYFALSWWVCFFQSPINRNSRKLLEQGSQMHTPGGPRFTFLAALLWDSHFLTVLPLLLCFQGPGVGLVWLFCSEQVRDLHCVLQKCVGSTTSSCLALTSSWSSNICTHSSGQSLTGCWAGWGWYLSSA